MLSVAGALSIGRSVIPHSAYYPLFRRLLPQISFRKLPTPALGMSRLHMIVSRIKSSRLVNISLLRLSKSVNVYMSFA